MYESSSCEPCAYEDGTQVHQLDGIAGRRRAIKLSKTIVSVQCANQPHCSTWLLGSSEDAIVGGRASCEQMGKALFLPCFQDIQKL